MQVTIVAAAFLIVRINDFGEKRDGYEAAGVSEYLVYEVNEGRIEWWCLDHGRYRDASTADGVRRSERFVGLWLNEDALRRADATSLIETLRLGMATV